MKELIDKANVLVEALPYIRTFYGKTFVIKYGGAAQTDEGLKHAFAQDVTLLSFIGIRPVVVHGGGPSISAMMKRMGKEPSFVHGHRVTDEETMEIVEMVLGGLVNKQIVTLINRHGGRAVGLSGKDGGLIKAKKKLLTGPAGGEEEMDIGLVGEVTEVNPDVLVLLDQGGFIPVISPVGAGLDGETFNINGDEITAAVAGALRAEKLIHLTDTNGVRDGEGKTLASLTVREVRGHIASKTISGGMLPKVDACIKALEAGVGKTHIIDGRVAHSLLLEIFTDRGIGTEIKA